LVFGVADAVIGVQRGRGSSAHVPRRDLLKLLDESACPVTVISAPAGSGKTVLLRSWASGQAYPVAWVTIGRSERDAHHFWSSVVGALRAAAPGAAIEALTPSPGFDGGALVDRLVAEAASLQRRLVLVIDDLHELTSPEALAQLAALLERLPDALQVVLATRRDPHLGLHRRRLAGELSEIRAADLRFSVAEARELLAGAGVELPETSLALLHERTEGWAAGLRLAAISLAAEPDPARYVAEFSGSARTVADYLFTEVLDRQPAAVRRLLLRTSVLERVSGPLADLLTGGSGAEHILQALEEAGAFVVAVDPGRTWFRYHRLFADLLALELRRTEPAAIPLLHATAARWYADRGQPLEAIRHAQAAGEEKLAVGLLSDHTFALLLDGRQATAHEILGSIPLDPGAADPELAILLAHDQLWHGSLDDAESHIRLAERHADAVPADRRRRFEVLVAVARLSLARRRGDFNSVRDLIQAPGAPADAHAWSDIAMGNDLRALALLNLGIAEARSGRADGARHLEEARSLAQRIGRPYLEAGALAQSAATTPQSFYRSETACREAIAMAERHGWGSDPVIAPALVMLAAALMQTGRFEEPGQWLDRAERALRAEVEPAAAFVLHAVRGGLHQVHGRGEEAIASLGRAEQLTALLVSSPPLALHLRCATLHARLTLGQTDAVRTGLAGLSGAERGSGEARTVLAALALADADPQAALAALAPVLEGSAPVHHETVLVRALVFAALAHDRVGDGAEAEVAVERALDLAEPDGLVMPFADTPSRPLLARHPRHRTAHAAFLTQLLDVLSAGSPAAAPTPIREALSDPELRVLRYLPSNLPAEGIASELYVSVNTVKTHLRHIYAKLDVHTRAQAVQRARELRLLAPSRR
jgi:LuxR family maltose regulon positive regulatory protein